MVEGWSRDGRVGRSLRSIILYHSTQQWNLQPPSNQSFPTTPDTSQQLPSLAGRYVDVIKGVSMVDRVGSGDCWGMVRMVSGWSGWSEGNSAICAKWACLNVRKLLSVFDEKVPGTCTTLRNRRNWYRFLSLIQWLPEMMGDIGVGILIGMTDEWKIWREIFNHRSSIA